MLESTGLTDRRQQLAGTLSGGWKQRVALACATIHEPPLLFLDEPTAGVDPVSRREFWERIYAISAEGTTAVLTTHYMDEAERCHRLAFIFGGSLLDVGTPDEIVERRELRVAELEVERAPEAAAYLRAATPGVEEVAHYGHRLRLAAQRTEGPRRAGEGRRSRPEASSCAVPRDARDRRGRVRLHGAGGRMKLRALVIAWKELLQLRRDRLTLAMMAVMPVVLLLLFGYAINTDVRHIPTLVDDHDRSAASRDLARRMEATGFYDLVGDVHGYDEIERALRSGRARAALVVPPRYRRRPRRRRDRTRAARRRRLRPADRRQRAEHRGIARRGALRTAARRAPGARRRSPRSRRRSIWRPTSSTTPTSARPSTSCRASSASSSR